MADKKATVEKVNVDSVLENLELTAEKNADGNIVLDNGAEISETKFRLYFVNPADGMEVPDTFGDSETQIRKDAAIGIKFLKATAEADVSEFIGFVSNADIYVAPVEDEDEDSDTEDAPAEDNTEDSDSDTEDTDSE